MIQIDQEGGTRRAVMWKADDFGKTFDGLEVSRALDRYAGRVHCLSGMPKRSAVDKRYYAEINRLLGDGYLNYNIKLGTGDNPVAAALDGYRQVTPEDPIWGAFELELECELLRRAVGVQRDKEARRARNPAKLDATLDELTAVMRSTNVPLPAAPGEDDDL